MLINYFFLSFTFCYDVVIVVVVGSKPTSYYIASVRPSVPYLTLLMIMMMMRMIRVGGGEGIATVGG